MFDSIIKNISSNLVWSEGSNLLKVIIVQAVILIFLSPLISWFYISAFGLSVVLQCAFIYYFFRNPLRAQVAYDVTQILSPADGRIIEIKESESSSDLSYRRVSIFLSPLDVHVQWIPMAGKITKLKYSPGTFTPAFLEKSEANEQNEITIKSDFGTIGVRQIAGFLARRISCWIVTGEEVSVGQKYGMIKFGSRVDIILPIDVRITVYKGQRVLGGITQIGMWQKED